MNYYQILGLTSKATDSEIKEKYRKLAKRYHPDVKRTGDVDKFKRISEAYKTLIDKDKRRKYDDKLRGIRHVNINGDKVIDGISNLIKFTKKNREKMDTIIDSGMEILETITEMRTGRKVCPICKGQGRFQIKMPKTIMEVSCICQKRRKNA